MTRYHKVPSRIWLEPWFRSGGEDARAAALYLLTCPHRTTEGLFRLPVPLAAHDVGWPVERFQAAVAALSAEGFVELDPATDLVWLVDALATDAPRGPKQVKGAVRALAELPPTSLRAGYLTQARELCPEFAEAIETALGWVSDTPSHTPSDTPSDSDPEPHAAPSTPAAVDNGEAPETPVVEPADTHCDTPSHTPSGTASIPQSPITHHPSPITASTTTPRSTQEGDPPDPGGGGGGSDSDQLDGAVDRPSPEWLHAADLARLALADAGVHLDATDPLLAETRHLQRAVRRGWPDQVLVDVGADALAAEVDRPRAWVVGAWKRMADEDPPDSAPDGGDPTPPAVPDVSGLAPWSGPSTDGRAAAGAAKAALRAALGEDEAVTEGAAG